LQRQGFNLVAIQAMLGVPGLQPDGDSADQCGAAAAEADPYLMHALTRHGVMVRGADHSVRMVRPTLLRCAMDLRRAGVRPDHILQVLSTHSTGRSASPTTSCC